MSLEKLALKILVLANPQPITIIVIIMSTLLSATLKIFNIQSSSKEKRLDSSSSPKLSRSNKIFS